MTKNITQLPAAAALDGTETVHGIQDGADVAITVDDIRAIDTVISVNGRGGVVIDLAEQVDLDAEVARATAAEAAAVKLTGAQTKAGVLTLSDAPVVPDGSFTTAKTFGLPATLAGLQAAVDAKAADSAVVHKTGAETIAGVKTFSSPPAVPDGSWTTAKTTGLQAALDAKAVDTAVVHKTGTETIAGAKTFSSVVRVPDGTFSVAGLQVGAAGTGIYRMPDGELGFVVDGALIFHTSEAAGTGLRRDMGNPFIGGRIYVEDEFFVEDDLWADEGIQLTSVNLPVTSTTLTAMANAGASTIEVASVPGAWVVDKTLHITKTTGTQYDRPRIRSIAGTTITLESPLQYTYPSGTVVMENPWRGAIFPTASWPVPSGIMSVGADMTAAETAATQGQAVLMTATHCRYRLGLAKVFSPEWVAEGGLTTATGGFGLSVSAAVFAHDSDVCQSTTQSLTVTTPHATLPRIDIVVLNEWGVASLVAGSPNASPSAPATPAGSVKVAQVAVAAAAASIIQANITYTLTTPMRLRVTDPANGGYVFGPADNTGVRVRVFTGSLHIVEGIDAGSFSTLDLNPSGGQVTVGAGGLAVAGPFGANGATAVGKQTLGAAATDAATTQTLANNLRSALIAIGLGQT